MSRISNFGAPCNKYASLEARIRTSVHAVTNYPETGIAKIPLRCNLGAGDDQQTLRLPCFGRRRKLEYMLGFWVRHLSPLFW